MAKITVEVRNVFGELERLGLLMHPHTSAGRVPTEGGFRIYADDALERQRLEPRPDPLPLDLTSLRSEVEVALETTTELLANVTRPAARGGSATLTRLAIRTTRCPSCCVISRRCSSSRSRSNDQPACAATCSTTSSGCGVSRISARASDMFSRPG